MHTRLEPITRPDQAYWVRNLIPWAMGEEELEVLVVDVLCNSLVRSGAFVRYGPDKRHRTLAPWSELASSPKRLAAKIAKWEPLRKATA